MEAAALEDPHPPDTVVPLTVASLTGVHPTETHSMEAPHLLGMVVPPMATSLMGQRPMEASSTEEIMVAHIKPLKPQYRNICRKLRE